MSRLLTVAAYAMHNMPLGTTFNAPVLTDEQYDVAGYIVTRDRPKKGNLDEDFPIRLQKPIDTPYGLMRTALQRNSTYSVRSVQSGPR